ncbi:TipJ family phage tail tip protein, partial [Actinobacillus porcinus]|uniref:TipJ family phage tail tip protein n=1 Tax=Actinobacillus porcinus TaxID=51048 RepID=UPI002355B0EE
MTSQLTMSETLESLLTDRKILLFRYDANLRKEIFKKLTALQKQLLTRVSAAGIESISKSELQSLLKDVKTLITDTYTDVNAYSSKELNALLPIETDATAKIYNESVQFDLFNIVPERTLNAAKNADLIAGTPLKDWWAKQGDDLAFKFSALIRQGMIDGKQTSRLITETKDLLAHSRRGAETLVRTAVMKVHDKAQELFKDENLDLLKGEKHLSTLDTRTSEICRVRDGLAWDLDKKPIGEHAVPYARPPLHPNCRSTLILITKSWKELGLDMDEIPESTRASMDGQVKAGLTYENWLKNKTPEQQDAILGKGKADLWRQGVITFRDMLDQSGRPLTLKDLYLTDARITRLRFNVGVKMLYSQNDQGDTNPTSVTLRISVGDQHYDYNIHGKYSSQYLEKFEVANLPPVPFNIRVERITADSEKQRLQNGTIWTSYTEIIDTDFTYPKADNALSGITAEQKARADGDKANADKVTALTARVGSAESGIATLQTSVATANRSVSELSQNLNAKIDG